MQFVSSDTDVELCGGVRPYTLTPLLPPACVTNRFEIINHYDKVCIFYGLLHVGIQYIFFN